MPLALNKFLEAHTNREDESAFTIEGVPSRVLLKYNRMYTLAVSSSNYVWSSRNEIWSSRNLESLNMVNQSLMILGQTFMNVLTFTQTLTFTIV